MNQHMWQNLSERSVWAEINNTLPSCTFERSFPNMKYQMNEEKPVACCIESTLSHCSCKLHVATRDQTLVTGAGNGRERDVFPL